jgi:hypothetical protein
VSWCKQLWLPCIWAHASSCDCHAYERMQAAVIAMHMSWCKQLWLPCVWAHASSCACYAYERMQAAVLAMHMSGCDYFCLVSYLRVDVKLINIESTHAQPSADCFESIPCGCFPQRLTVPQSSVFSLAIVAYQLFWWGNVSALHWNTITTNILWLSYKGISPYQLSCKRWVSVSCLPFRHQKLLWIFLT